MTTRQLQRAGRHPVFSPSTTNNPEIESPAPTTTMMMMKQPVPGPTITSPTKIPRPPRPPTSPIDTRTNPTPTLGPSPVFREQPTRSTTKTPALTRSPETPKKQQPGLGLRGISLQLTMPAHDGGDEVVASFHPASSSSKIPISPKPSDVSPVYASPGSVLPRRSRGLDYTRACTNLHHSMIAEQSSPDSSPVIGGRGGMSIPRRIHMMGSGPDSPKLQGVSHWTTSYGHGDTSTKTTTTMAGSMGSVNMLGSGSDSDSSDDDMANDEENTIHMTPQQPFRNTNVFGITANASPGMESMSSFSQAAASLMSFQRRTRKSRSTRHSSSNSSGRSSMPSPVPVSPPLHSKTSDAASSSSHGYFEKHAKSKPFESRRESLSLGTGDLKISDSLDDDSGDHGSMSDALGLSLNTSSIDGRRNVIKRAVTRRSNMMPKPKGFARIRAALQEEVSPVDTESRREAEVIRQVRESDNATTTETISSAPSQPATTVSSPSLMPANHNKDEGLEDLTELMAGEVTLNSRRGSLSVSSSKPPHLRNSIGHELADHRTRTPPPPPFLGRSNSSGISEDVAMDTPASSLYSLNHTRNSSPSRSSTPQQQQPPSQIEAATRPRALGGKRRRDDDLDDPSFFKRRAVSPGVSHQSSPILPPSPAQREGGVFWSREAASALHRSGSTGSSGVAAAGSVGKVIGMKGMNDTNDGLMNMTIE